MFCHFALDARASADGPQDMVPPFAQEPVGQLRTSRPAGPTCCFVVVVVVGKQGPVSPSLPPVVWPGTGTEGLDVNVVTCVHGAFGGCGEPDMHTQVPSHCLQSRGYREV